MPLVKSSEDMKNDRCPKCGISFMDHPLIKTRVYKNFRYCLSYAACMTRARREQEKQRGNRDNFGKDQKNECEMIVTGNYVKGQPFLNVRCYCMARFGAKKYTSFKYDILGSVDTMPEAFELWQTHVRGLTSIPLNDTVNAKEDQS